MRFEIAADTDRGIVKETNQDSLLVKCFSTCKGDMAFAVLCDGMGGLSKGELASATVVRAFDRWSDEQLPELCKSSNPDIDSLILERQWDEVIQQQNEKIKAYGKAHAVNMGTTVVALLVTQKAYYIINVGDSRIYSLSDHIERLTTDQTYVQREIMNGNMTQEQAMKDPRRNVLLQCVGASAEVKPEYRANIFRRTDPLKTVSRKLDQCTAATQYINKLLRIIRSTHRPETASNTSGHYNEVIILDVHMIHFLRCMTAKISIIF